MANSGLITNGLGGNLITHGMGRVTAVTEPPVVTPQPSPSGGGVVVPQAIARAEIKIKVNHISAFKKRFAVITEHVDEVIKLPIKIRHVVLNLQTNISELTLNTFIKGLSLDIRQGGLELE